MSASDELRCHFSGDIPKDATSRATCEHCQAIRPSGVTHVEIMKCRRKGPPSRGLGDTIAKVTRATGIDAAVSIVEKVTGVDCGCAGRVQSLNAAVPYTPPPQT